MLEQHSLDKTVPIPLYFQLKNLLLEEIKSNVYPVDSLIPTEKEISEMFDISRTTVRQAITELVQEGWLYRIKSKGTFVARTKIKQDFIRRLEPFNEQIARTGRKPSTELLALEIGDSVAENFGVTVVDAQFKKEDGKQILRIFIDKDGGVGIDDCEAFSRAFGDEIDKDDPIETEYVLEVSSP